MGFSPVLGMMAATADGSGLMDLLTQWVTTHGPKAIFNLLIFFALLAAGFFGIGIVLRFTYVALERSHRVSEILARFIVNILHKVLWGVIIMMALPQLGIDVAPLIAGLGVGGFIVGFAFQESLGNLAAGLMLLLNQPYAIGNYVEIGGVAGTVREMNIMATVLTTPDNKRVLVPNRKIWGTEIVNYTAMPERRLDILVSIHYKADIGKALETAKAVVENHELTLKEPAPVIGVKELADSGIILVVRPWVKTKDYWTAHFDITRKVKEAFDREGVGIPFPQLDVHLIDVPKDLQFPKSA